MQDRVIYFSDSLSMIKDNECTPYICDLMRSLYQLHHGPRSLSILLRI